MSLIARRQKQFPPPAAGQHDAVLVDVVDEGEKESAWGVAHKVRLVFELGPTAGTRDDGRRHSISGWYTLSLAPSANLTRDLGDWGVLPDDVESSTSKPSSTRRRGSSSSTARAAMAARWRE